MSKSNDNRKTVTDTTGWKEAAIAWECCASLHREYAKGKDPFFTTRQRDFTNHAEHARAAYSSSLSSAPEGEVEKLVHYLRLEADRDESDDDYDAWHLLRAHEIRRIADLLENSNKAQ